MDFEWTQHRFSGGLLALDVANTVVRRNDPARRCDRFEDRENIPTFVQAAKRFRASEFPNVEIAPPIGEAEVMALIALRESIDDFARPRVLSQSKGHNAVVRLFEMAAAASRGADLQSGAQSVGYLASISAMKLLDERLLRRCKICPDCEWLFVDQSKNQSRMWCDMAVCGNRAKARAHYARAVKAPKSAGRTSA